MQITSTVDVVTVQREAWKSPQQRNLAGACLAHMLHDGYTDQLYALLPVWQSLLGLSYAGLAVVRALYFGTMGGLQVPGDKLVARLNPREALALATFVAAAGFLLVSLPFGFPGLCAGLVLAGIGSSIQHPRASLLVTNTYGKASRGPLGIYNFDGDLGKAVFPALVALLLTVVAWRPVVGMMAGIGAATQTLVNRQHGSPVYRTAPEAAVILGTRLRGFPSWQGAPSEAGYVLARLLGCRTGQDGLQTGRAIRSIAAAPTSR